ncbi:MAG: N-acetylmuramoyl-L-alanine amidase [Deltaproteobacteria bacterium]
MRIRTIATALFIAALMISQKSAAASSYEERLFDDALNLYKTLISDSEKVKEYEIWDTIAQSFYTIYTTYPRSSPAADSLFLCGKMYEEMGARFNSKEDFSNSVGRSREFISAFPKNPLADDAQLRIARILEMRDKSEAYAEYERVVRDFPKGDMKIAAQGKLRELKAYKNAERKPVQPDAENSARLAQINEIRQWSNDSYTRVVIGTSREIPFEAKALKPDPKLHTTHRVYVDIKDATVDLRLKPEKIEDGLLRDIRFGRNTPDTVRVVLDVNSLKNYRVFALRDPHRIVMDIYGEDGNPAKTPAVKRKDSFEDRTLAGLPKFEDLDGANISSLRGALGLKVRTIVIDPGHGGHDPGAIGPSGLKEKDVNLAIGKALKKKIEKEGREFGITRVLMTREDDRFIPLEERTAIAKKQGADIFISIHCNAAKNREAHGIETYILSFTKDPEALALAARENASTAKGISDLRDIIKKYLLSSKIDESTRLANHVQGSVMNQVSKKYDSVKSKGVKKAPFIVLIGADVPSILIETAFISNPREEARLKNEDYVRDIAEGIFAGIKKYSNEVETASIAQ